ncbi:MAG: HPr family phosphocarrier protein [Raineyella sp.]|nr:HPr family phosphocarrier protein [Raineyella sp.]MEA5155258.1 HPr family phosphocarrier protein [Raineyella sp.]
MAAEARAGLRAKQELLDDTAPRTDTAPLTGDGPASEPRHVPATATLSRDVAVTSPLGLHLRSVARLVALVGSYAADVRLADPARGNGPVDATSITDVLALAAGPGDTLRVEATGRQAREVLEAIAASAVTGFGDLEEPGPDRMPATDAADEGTRADRST